MALTIVDNRDIINECDATTSWTATDGPIVFTSQPDPIEAGACLGLTASNAVEDAYVAITSANYLSGTISIWIQDRAEFAPTTGVGEGIQVGDGTNRIAYAVGGSDGTAFRHDTGPVKWANFLLDLANKPTDFVTLGGTEANLDETAITQVGVYFETLVKSVGGADNCFWDIMRYAPYGSGLEIYGGTSGTPEVLLTLAEADRSVGNQQAYGIMRELATKVYGVQGNINLGDATSTNATYIDISNEVIAFENRSLSTGNYYRFTVDGNATNPTVVTIDTSVLTVSVGASAIYDSQGTNVDNQTYGSVLAGFDQGVNIGGTGDWTTNSFNSCGIVRTTGANLSLSSFNNSVAASGNAALYWDSTTDPNLYLNGTSYTKGTGVNHAIAFPTGMTGSITLTDLTTAGYNVDNGSGDSTFSVLATTSSLTINVVGGDGNFSYKTAGATVSVVIDPVTSLVTTLDNRDASELQDVRVILRASSAAGDFPFDDTVTITRSGSTASVLHTTHGMSNGDKVQITGADQQEYNGVYVITNVTTNAYDYTVSGTPATTATGTIKATGVVLEGLTDVNGEISSSRTWTQPQPVEGRARKSTASPYFKQGKINGTVSNSAGFSSTISLVIDE
jgi:hypothetical protein